MRALRCRSIYCPRTFLTRRKYLDYECNCYHHLADKVNSNTTQKKTKFIFQLCRCFWYSWNELHKRRVGWSIAKWDGEYMWSTNDQLNVCLHRYQSGDMHRGCFVIYFLLESSVHIIIQATYSGMNYHLDYQQTYIITDMGTILENQKKCLSGIK